MGISVKIHNVKNIDDFSLLFPYHSGNGQLAAIKNAG